MGGGPVDNTTGDGVEEEELEIDWRRSSQGQSPTVMVWTALEGVVTLSVQQRVYAALLIDFEPAFLEVGAADDAWLRL